MTIPVTDFSQYNTLRVEAQADSNSEAVLREVATQFEALFVQTLLKEMREASLGDPILGSSNEHKTYTEMFDQQLASELASHQGFGIADALVRQLTVAEPATAGSGIQADGLPLPPRSASLTSRSTSLPPETAETSTTPSQVAATPETKSAPATEVDDVSWESPRDFVRDIWPEARRTARRLGVPPEALVAQAALETGWGARVIRAEDGTNSFNLFGVKAGSDWEGGSVNKRTLEFENGMPRQVRDRFRAYSDVSQAFDDYARVLESRPRYSDVTNTSGDEFPRRLQEAGYATDPEYATKIKRVMRSQTLRDALAVLPERIARTTSTTAALTTAP